MSGDEDRVQHGANHGGGCTLLLRAEALRFHDDLHILNIQEEFLLGNSEGAMVRRDYPLLGHGNTGARRVQGPHPASRGEPGGRAAWSGGARPEAWCLLIQTTWQAMRLESARSRSHGTEPTLALSTQQAVRAHKPC